MPRRPDATTSPEAPTPEMIEGIMMTERIEIDAIPTLETIETATVIETGTEIATETGHATMTVIDDALAQGRESAKVDAQKPADTAPTTTAVSTPAPVEDEKMRMKRERLEAWKKEREAKKALEEAKAKALALAAGGAGISASLKAPASAKLPAKPTAALNRTNLPALGLKGLPLKPDVLKNAKTAAAMDDFTESGRKLVKLDDMPPVDMAQVDGGVGENLEADDDDDAAAAMQDSVMKDADDDEELDPLDAFMSGVNDEVKKVNAEDRKRVGGDRMEVDGADDGDEEEQATPDELDAAGLRPEDILALAAKKIKKKDLAVVDHAKVSYEPFRSNFYIVPPEIADMTEAEVEVERFKLDDIKIRGMDCPRPIIKWSHCGLPASCLDVIKKLGYEAPTPIQSQAMPAIMSGRDVIGVAKTGSGKTMAFVLPLLRHIKDQRPLEPMEGPMALIMTPTRELAVQIHRECKPFLKALNLRAVCAYGGSPIKDQIAEMKKGAEIAVCTPGRMIDLLTANSGRVTNLKREVEELANGFLEKVKEGKVKSFTGAGFGGKGLDKLDKERDAKEKAQRSAYGEADEKAAVKEEEGTTKAEATESALPFDFKVEIKRGPAPDTSKGVGAAAKPGDKTAKGEPSKDATAFERAQSVIAKLNAQVKATKLAMQGGSTPDDAAGRKPKDPDATDFHAIIPINDYPQKARWRVTNKETMVQLVDLTGASVTNKGIYYEPGKEPGPDQPPKLHLLIESNDEFRVEQAVREIKRLLIEASTAALQAESRNPQATAGRYSVV
ncbi:pre-mRNA processing RNA-helicase [Tulasnella sp. 427]|nr:pre-mRNA processing RNA-helicase [Tulasnella sp. 427]